MEEKPNELIAEAMGLIEKDLNHLKSEVKTGALRDGRAKVLAEYMRTLVSVSKDLRQSKEKEEDDLSKLSDEELLEKAKQAMKGLDKK